VKKLNKEEIEAEKSKLEATFNKEWKKLEKQREKFLIDSKEGYNCKKCGKFREKSKNPLSHETHELCWECYNTMQQEKNQKDFLTKIRGAKIVNVELTYYNTIKSLTVCKNATMFRFIGETDDDEVSYIELDDEWHEEEQIKIRPGDKPRLEKPLAIIE
jgi:predicted nuclease with TOPRIM domain